MLSRLFVYMATRACIYSIQALSVTANALK